MKYICYLIIYLLFISGTSPISVTYIYNNKSIEVTSKRIIKIKTSNYLNNNHIKKYLNNYETVYNHNIDTSMRVNDVFKKNKIIALAALINSECSICTEIEKFTIAASVVNRNNINYRLTYRTQTGDLRNKPSFSLQEVIFSYKQFSGTVINNNCLYPTNNPKVGKLFIFNKNNDKHLNNYLIARAAYISQNSNNPLVSKDLIYFFRRKISTDKDFIKSFNQKNNYYPAIFEDNKIYHEFYLMEKWKVKYYVQQANNLNNCNQS